MIIQKYSRRHLAKKELEKRRKEKQDYEELMDKIQKEVGYFSMTQLALKMFFFGLITHFFPAKLCSELLSKSSSQSLSQSQSLN